MVVDESIGGFFSDGPDDHHIACSRHDEHNTQQQPQKASYTEGHNCGYNTKQQQRHPRTNDILPFGHRHVDMTIHPTRKEAETEVAEAHVREEEPCDAVNKLVDHYADH